MESWCGHVHHTPPHSEIKKAPLISKYTCKNALLCGHELDLWMTVVDNRHKWRSLIHTVCDSHNVERVKEDDKH